MSAEETGAPSTVLPNGWYTNREGQVAWWDGSRWTLRAPDSPALPPLQKPSPSASPGTGTPVAASGANQVAPSDGPRVAAAPLEQASAPGPTRPPARGAHAQVEPASTQAPIPEPTVSSDGRFWWDGHQWHPVAHPEVESPPGAKRSVRQQIVRGALFGITLLIIICVILVVQENRRAAEFERDSRDAHCESFGRDNPDC